MKKIEPWRLVLGLASFAYIVYMWVRKDIAGIWGRLPKEELLPIVLTSTAVSVLKIAAIAAAVFLARWLIRKFSKK
jgi:hypothetical protein